VNLFYPPVALGLSTGGNTGGNTGTSFGTWVLVGSDNVSLSESTAAAGVHSIYLSAAAGGGGAGSNTLGMSNLGNTSGTTGVVSGSAVRYLFAGGNNVTLSQSVDGVSGTVTISAFNQSVESQSLGMSNLGNTSGTTGIASGAQVRFLFAGGNNVTLSQSVDGASGTITVSAFNQSVESQSIGMSNVGNTSGTTGMASGAQVRYVLAGGNNVTLSQSVDGASGTVTISAFNQSVESQSIGMSNVGNTSGTTGVASGAQVRYVLAGGNNITLSQSLDGASGTVTISAFSQSAESNTHGMSNLGNTSGTTGVVSGNQVRYLFAGGNNVTLSQSLDGVSGTVTISAFNQSVESQSIGMSNLGNTSGTTGMASGAQVRFAFAGGANITLSQSLDGASGTITISGGAGGAGNFSAGMSNLGDTSGTSGTVSNRLVLVGSHGIGLSGSVDGESASVTIVPRPHLQTWSPFGAPNHVSISSFTVGQGSITVMPAYVPWPMSMSMVQLAASISGSSNAASSYAGVVSVHVGLYTKNASTMSLATSGSQSYQWTVTGTTSHSLVTGLKGFTVPITLHADPGEYYVAALIRTSTTNNNWFTASWLAANMFANHYHGPMFSSNAASQQLFLGRGYYSATSANLPNSMAFSDLTGTNNLAGRPLMMCFQNLTVP
jgi:hypothetical protein